MKIKLTLIFKGQDNKDMQNHILKLVDITQKDGFEVLSMDQRETKRC